MYLYDGIALIGSGHHGFSLSHRCDSHIYLVKGEAESAIIDAGAGIDVRPVLEELSRVESGNVDRVRKVVLTHAHADHAGGAARLREELGAEVLCSPEVATIMRAGDEERAGVPVGKRSGTYDSGYNLEPSRVDGELEDGDSIDLGGVRLRAVATPGHSVGHLALLAEWRARSDLFSGDALLFGGRVIVQDTWDCDLRLQVDSLHRLEQVHFDGLYPGHYSFSVTDGRRHLERALSRIKAGGVPELL